MPVKLPIYPLLVNARDAARMLSMSKSFFYENLATHRIDIPAIHVGTKRLFSVESLAEWVRKETKKNKATG